MSDKTLRDWMPRQYFGGEWDDEDPSWKHLDKKIVKEHEHGRWPGKHRNVLHWVELEGGILVGFNENPSRGWSFPVMRKKK